MDGSRATSLATKCKSPDEAEGFFSSLLSKASTHRLSALEQRNEDLASTNRHLRLTIERLERLVYLDDLTGLSNRRYFDSALETEIRRAARERTPLTLFLCDIDHFKLHNDTFGHRGGDALLRAIADVLKRFCRRGGDRAARYGGEEFALILPQLAATDAVTLAEELRDTISELTICHRGGNDLRQVTISIGVTTFAAHVPCDPCELIDAADNALYAAKRAGRNRTRFQALRGR
jgi:diguanylate cyclase (GGDEF)-like protein